MNDAPVLASERRLYCNHDGGWLRTESRPGERPGAPVERSESVPPLEVINTIALFRLILPEGTIKIAGRGEANLRDLQSLALIAGGNGLILGDYLTTQG